MNHELPLSLAQRIDVDCDRFEVEWKAGKNPKIEEFLGATEDAQRSALLRALMQVELELNSNGDSTVSQQHYLDRFPDDRDLVEELFRTQDNAPKDYTLSLAKPAVDTSQLDRSNLPKQHIAASEPEQIGRFRILSTLGRGAFGKVYKAYDPQLDREVALKVPKAGVLETEYDVERFLREAKAAASIHHPNICPVYETGQVDGHYYIVMAYIEGRTLAEVIRESERHDHIRVGTLLHKVALALEAAHEKGIVHRDLKPANIMIDKQGEPIVMDFGLARRSETEDSKLTHSGQILGTPAYMSPEQARGDIEKLDARTDVYSLGIILYEMLCGSVPFRGSVAEVLSHILHDDPKLPSEIRKKVDKHLELVCLKAIAKEADDRFASMREMAAALAGEMETVDIRLPARRVKFRARVRRWTMIGLATAFLLLLAGVIIYVRTDYGTVKIEVHDPNLQVTVDNNVFTFKDGKQTIRLRRGKNSMKLETLDQNGKVVETQIKQIKVKRGVELQLHVALDADGKIVVIMGDQQLPDWLVAKIAARNGPMIGPAPPVTPLPDGPPGESRQFPSDSVIDAALSSDSRLAVTTVKNGATIWDLATKKKLTDIDSENNWVWCVDLSPDSRYAAIGTVDHNLYLHDAKTGKRLRPLVGHEGNLVTVKFTPDSKQIVSWAFDGTIRVWDVETGREDKARKIDVNTTRELFASYTRQVHFSHDAKLAAVAALDSLVQLWDVQTGKMLTEFQGHTDKTIAAAISRDGRRVVSTALDRTIRLWDAKTGEQLIEIPDLGMNIASVEFTPDGRWFAASLYDGTLRMWDSKTGEEKYRTTIVERLAGQAPPSAIRLSFTPDNRFLMTGANDGTMRMWRLPDFNDESNIPSPGPISKLASIRTMIKAGLSSDPFNERVTKARSELIDIHRHTLGTPEALEAARLMRRIAWPLDAMSRDKIDAYELNAAWRDKPNNAPQELVGIVGDSRMKHWSHVLAVALSPDGKSMASAARSLCVWDYQSGQLRFQRNFETADQVKSLAFSPDNKLLVSGHEDGMIKFWNVATGDCRATLNDHKGVLLSLAFSPDGKMLASAANKKSDKVIRLWEVETAKLKAELKGHSNSISSLAFHPQGKWLASGGKDRSILIWNTETLEPPIKIKNDNSPVRAVGFSADGNTLFSADITAIKKWNWTAAEMLEEKPIDPGRSVMQMTFAPGGETLASASWGSSLQLYDVATGKVRKGGYSPSVTALAFNADGKSLAMGMQIGQTLVLETTAGSITNNIGFQHSHTQAVAFRNDGTLVVTASQDGSARAWEIPTAKLSLKTPNRALWSNDMQVSPDGSMIAIGGWGSIGLWDIRLGKWLPGLKSPGWTWKIAFSPDGNVLVSRHSESKIKFWDMRKRQPFEQQLQHGSSRKVSWVAFSPDSKLLAISNNDDHTIEILEFATGKVLHKMTGHSDVAVQMAFRGDGKVLASVGNKGTLLFWDLTTGKNMAALETGQQLVTAKYNFDGSILATLTTKGVIQLRDPTSGEVRRTIDLGDPPHAVNSDGHSFYTDLEFSSDGRHLATANKNGTAFILRLTELAEALKESPPPAIAPFDTAKANQHQQAWAEHLGTPIDQENSIGMKLRLIPPGEFDRGSSAKEITELVEEGLQYGDVWTALIPGEGPRRRVRITRPFFLGAHEVTCGQFRAFVEQSKYKTDAEKAGGKSWRDATAGVTDNHPVTEVSWNDANAFCAWLSKKEGKTYTLPTEAQWEYAGRSGSTTRWFCGNDKEQLKQYAWFGGEGVHAVGTKLPNAFGLFDVTGNVWEWCADWRDDKYYADSPADDPPGPANGKDRVLRGGSGNNCDWGVHLTLRFTNRQLSNYPLGFRVALALPQKNQLPPPAIAPFDAAQAKQHQESWAMHLGMQVQQQHPSGMTLNVIPPGEFTMGSASGQKDESPHKVRITKPFLLTAHEITQLQYRAVTGKNPSGFASTGLNRDKINGDSDRRPVERVSWYDAVEFCNALSKAQGLAPFYALADVERGPDGSIRKATITTIDNDGYRLPSEAEWEYACRAGTVSKWSSGDDESKLSAQLATSSAGATQPVGGTTSNAFGLHDMHGNVWEWCGDWYGKDASTRVIRGGSWFFYGQSARSANRENALPGERNTTIGLRVAQSLPTGK